MESFDHNEAYAEYAKAYVNYIEPEATKPEVIVDTDTDPFQTEFTQVEPVDATITNSEQTPTKPPNTTADNDAVANEETSEHSEVRLAPKRRRKQ